MLRRLILTRRNAIFTMSGVIFKWRTTTRFARRRFVHVWSDYFSAKQRYICSENDRIYMKQQLICTEKGRICNSISMEQRQISTEKRGICRPPYRYEMFITQVVCIQLYAPTLYINQLLSVKSQF